MESSNKTPYQYIDYQLNLIQEDWAESLETIRTAMKEMAREMHGMSKDLEQLKKDVGRGTHTSHIYDEY